MKKTPKFYITDVFAAEKYTGNQLATFINGESFSDQEMQRIAREINFSETTFITSAKFMENEYTVRIFTPVEELPFAGHPTLGTSYVIRNFVALGKPTEIILDLKVGKIPVTFVGDQCWMKQVEPRFGEVIDKGIMADIISLDKSELDEKFPVQEVSTGIPIWIVPLKGMQSLKKIRINKEKYFNLVNKSNAKAIYAYCPEGYEKHQDLSARLFADYLGVPEDPATGSACGCLAGYLMQNNYYHTETISKQIGQGYEINRPSTLFLKASKQGDSISIHVGGSVQKIAEGFWVND
ncbi:MAG: PhzF family phenazine biosynthesis protein [Bacteroidales bacterium]|nr:PhzF family phenazine biosynthesis protein [Bacteroidales bacterium]